MIAAINAIIDVLVGSESAVMHFIGLLRTHAVSLFSLVGTENTSLTKEGRVAVKISRSRCVDSAC